MKSKFQCLVIAGFLALPISASAGLMFDISGVVGAGFTSITLSGNSTTLDGGTIRTSTGASFSGDDSWEASADGDFINDAAIQDAIFAITGTASVTIGGITESITHIFLDEDGGAFDDLGIRTANPLPYDAGVASSWTGAFTVALDFGAFNLGSFPSAGTGGTGSNTGPWFSLESDVLTSLSPATVPAPASLALLGLGLLGLMLSRRS